MKTIRVKLTEETQETLDEIRAHLNCNWQVAANIAILNGRNAIGSGKSDTSKGKSAAGMPDGKAEPLYIYNTYNNKKVNSNEKLIPDNFDPPHCITDEAHLERDGAIFQFKKWAIAEKKRFSCWNEAFRFACNSWLPNANPQLKISKEPKLREL
tara:strand:+ start:3276 stop:3737 length:462 start_codon:yes stop_codon:yes gene_type:complete